MRSAPGPHSIAAGTAEQRSSGSRYGRSQFLFVPLYNFNWTDPKIFFYFLRTLFASGLFHYNYRSFITRTPYFPSILNPGTDTSTIYITYFRVYGVSIRRIIKYNKTFR